MCVRGPASFTRYPSRAHPRYEPEGLRAGCWRAATPKVCRRNWPLPSHFGLDRHRVLTSSPGCVLMGQTAKSAAFAGHRVASRRDPRPLDFAEARQGRDGGPSLSLRYFPPLSFPSFHRHRMITLSPSSACMRSTTKSTASAAVMSPDSTACIPSNQAPL